MAKTTIARIKISSNTSKHQLKRQADQIAKKIAANVEKEIKRIFQ